MTACIKKFTKDLKFSHHLFTLTCMSFFFLKNTKVDLSKNVGNQTTAVPINLHGFVSRQ